MWIVVCYRWVWRVPRYLPWVVWVVQWCDQCPAGSGATNGSAFSADLCLLAQRQARLCRVAGDWTLRQLAGSWGRPWLPRRDLASSVSRQCSQLWRYRVSQQAWYQGMTIDVSKPKLLSLLLLFILVFIIHIHRVQDGVKQVLPIKMFVSLYIYGVWWLAIIHLSTRGVPLLCRKSFLSSQSLSWTIFPLVISSGPYGKIDEKFPSRIAWFVLIECHGVFGKDTVWGVSFVL